MHRVVMIVLAVPALVSAQWQVDSTGKNATVSGIGGRVMFSCAGNAPSGNAVIVVFNGLATRGQRAGYVEVDSDRMSTTWECGPVSGSAMCAVAPANHVPRIRDMLIRGSAAMAVLGSANDPIGAVLVDLSGSARAIERVRSSCR